MFSNGLKKLRTKLQKSGKTHGVTFEDDETNGSSKGAKNGENKEVEKR